MKNLLHSEQHSKTISNIIVAAATVGMLAVLVYLQPILSMFSDIMGTVAPFFVGFALAFLQLPIVKRVDRFLARFMTRPKLTRGLAVGASLLLLLAIIAAFIGIVLPQLVDSIKQLVSNIHGQKCVLPEIPSYPASLTSLPPESHHCIFVLRQYRLFLLPIPWLLFRPIRL